MNKAIFLRSNRYPFSKSYTLNKILNRNKIIKQLLLNNLNTNILYQINEVKVYFVSKKKIFHPNLDKQKKSPLVLQKNPPKEFDSHTNPLCTKIMQLTQNR